MKTDVFEIQGLKCVIGYPTSYEKGHKYPVIIFLHGAGSRGEDIEILKNNPYFKIISQHKNFSFISVAPQCSKNTWFDQFEALKRMTEEITTYDFADSARIYLMGASMGGYAVWQLAMSMPEIFAAIVPICGGGMYWNAARLTNIPIWAFHGALDKTVLVEESVKMVDEVNRKKGHAKLTVYPNNSHDAWSDTYANFEVFQWLLTHTNKKETPLNDAYKGSAIYG